MAHTNSHTQPFLKWAGGKGQLLDQYEVFFPTHPMRDYYEPFVGSGAVFFRLRERGLFERYHLSDVNAELITCFLAVRDHVDELITRLAEHRDQHDHDYYYRIRALDRQPDWANAPGVERAARMIYLNKTCYNGLWRVNSKGQFNVPMGRYKNPDILNAERLRRASEALQGVEISVRNFEDVQAGPGDFVYFDPPYHPLSQTASFTSYSADSFGPEDQRRLAEVFAALADKGCRVMLSNSDTEFVRELYQDFRIETVTARRAINSAGGKRGPVSEIVIRNN
jgi:DNA adenine methylase